MRSWSLGQPQSVGAKRNLRVHWVHALGFSDRRWPVAKSKGTTSGAALAFPRHPRPRHGFSVPMCASGVAPSRGRAAGTHRPFHRGEKAVPGAGASMSPTPSFDRASGSTGCAGAKASETIAEMMVHDHLSRWCAAGGCSYAREEAPRAVPAAASSPPDLRTRGGKNGFTGSRGSGIPPAFTRLTGENGGGIAVGPSLQSDMGGKGRPLQQSSKILPEPDGDPFGGVEPFRHGLQPGAKPALQGEMGRLYGGIVAF